MLSYSYLNEILHWKKERLASLWVVRQCFAKWSMLVLLIYNSIALLVQENSWEGSESLLLSTLREYGLNAAELPEGALNDEVTSVTCLYGTQAGVMESGVRIR
jgi:hypothetical protein